LKPQRKITLRPEEERGGSPRRRRRFLDLLEGTLHHRKVDPFQELLYIYSLPKQAQGVLQEWRFSRAGKHCDPCKH